MEASPEGFGKASIFFKILYYFLPYSLILYSFVNDIILGTSMYWPAPLLGLGAGFLNTFVSKLLTGNVSIESDLCGIPGLTTVMPSFFAPQLIVVSGTILAYIASFNTSIKNQSTTLPFMSIDASWILFAAVIILQGSVLYTSKCLGGYYFPQFGGILAILIGIAIALVVGGGTGAGFATLPFFAKPAGVSPTLLGPGGTQRCPDGLPPDANGSCDRSSGLGSSKDPNVGTCSAPNDQDQFVCEAYKNGELVTSTITEGFIGK
jgi:hypothetical protein